MDEKEMKSLLEEAYSVLQCIKADVNTCCSNQLIVIYLHKLINKLPKEDLKIIDDFLIESGFNPEL